MTPTTSSAGTVCAPRADMELVALKTVLWLANAAIYAGCAWVYLRPSGERRSFVCTVCGSLSHPLCIGLSGWTAGHEADVPGTALTAPLSIAEDVSERLTMRPVPHWLH